MVSASALTAGMAHGAILYTYCDPANPAYTITNGVNSIYLDLNQNGIGDFQATFSGGTASKPYILNGPGLLNESITPYVLSDAVDGSHSQGLPLTSYGTDIGPSYESEQANGYFNQDSNANGVGGWTSAGNNEGYVGLVMDDGGGDVYYGWAHFIYDKTANAGTLQLVDYAMETSPNTDILAGQTDEAGTGPAIIYTPKSQVAGVGLSAKMIAAATGNPAPTYQWKAGAVGSSIYNNLVDGGGISGSTSNVLTLSNVALANQADYVVVVSNPNGTVVNPSPATLSVVPLAIASVTPSPGDLLPGGNATFRVNFSSSVPIGSIQWLKNGSLLSNGGRISGVTSSNLVISSLSPSDTANYSVVLTNTYGAITSIVDSVTVQTSSVPYANYVSSLRPVEYYRFDELADPASGLATVFDWASGLNGSYGMNTQNGNPTNNAIAGPLPTDGFAGFSSTNTAVSIVSPLKWYPSAVTIPGPNVNTNTVTMTAWIYPTTTVEPAYGVIISFRTAVSGTASGINLAGDGSLGYHWTDDGNDWNYSSEIFPPQNQWSFIAMVITPTNSTFYMFNTSGIQVASQTTLNNVAALNTPGHIGADANDANFIGNIDEVAIFNQSLTALQLTNMYSVAVTGILPTSPPTQPVLSIVKSGGNIVVSWNPSGGTLLEAPSVTGPWTVNSATSPYTNTTPTQAAVFYRVQTQ
jgi:hypothetical protein